MLRWSFDAILAAEIHDITVVVPADRVDEATRLLPEATHVVAGGATRQESVRAGLEHVVSDVVIVHDAARPFAPPQVFAAVIEALQHGDAAVPALQMKETVKLVRDGYVVETLEREQVWNVQTPQAFRTRFLLDAHQRAAAEGVTGTDDAQLIEHYGGTVAVAVGSSLSFKITDPDDLQRAEAHAREVGR